MQAALRFIGTNLRGFSQSRTVSLTLTHRRRPVSSGILENSQAVFVAFAGCCPAPLTARGVPCGGGAAGCCPLRLRSAGWSIQKERRGALSAPRRCAVSCVRLWSAVSPVRCSLRGSSLRRLPLPVPVQRSLQWLAVSLQGMLQ